jgi:hypothetical protein
MAAHVILSTPIPGFARYIVPGILVLFSATGTIQSANTSPGITTQFDPVSWINHQYDQDLIRFLKENGETRGYSNYWVAYPLAFLSNEELLFSPGLPYHQDLRHTNRDDRIPEYTKLVDESDRVAYITTFNPELDRALTKGFSRLGVTWEEKTFGDFHIFYRISRPVKPEEIKTELIPITE